MTASVQLGKIDLHQPPLEVLIAKINAINSMDLKSTDFTLSAPVVDVGTDALGRSWDTKITLNPSVGSVWIKALPVTYSRAALQDLMRVQSPVQTAGNAMLYEILDAVNAAYGIYLQEADVEQAVINYVESTDHQGPGTVEIVTRPTSVFYKGSMTIPVNTQARQGLNTYDDEAVYYVLARASGKDTVMAFNIRGEPVETFTAFKGATFSMSNVKHFEMQNNGNMVLIGDFTYTTTNSSGQSTEHIVKLIKISPMGDILETASGNIFGATYAGLQRVFDNATGAMYALDPTNLIGGRASMVHRFLPDGTYDNNFNMGAGGIATHIAFHDGFVYAVRQAAGVATITKHNALTGAADNTFGPLALSLAQGPLSLYAIAADANGIKVLVDSTPASTPVRRNGVPIWTPGPASADAFPSLTFTLQGENKPGSIYYRPGYEQEFVGPFSQTTLAKTLSSGWLVFATVGCHPYYGTMCQQLISASPEGEIVRSPGFDPKQAPRFIQINDIQHIENGDIAAVGTSWCVGTDMELTKGTALALYNRLGEVSATLVANHATGVEFKKVFGRVP